jgi:2-polyprenyl-3-methyl-5-hydroxy-6-metoxy-1,4-benzoquinol methylase
MESLQDINKKSWECRQKESNKKYKFANRFKIAYERLDHHKPRFWLDIGTGNGYLPSLLRDRLSGTLIIGIDFVREILREAKDLNQCLQVDIDRTFLPFRDHSFDMITCMDVLEHLILPDKLLHEINRVLKPGGHCLLSVPNIQFIEYILSFIKGKVPLPAADPRHMSIYTIKHLQKLLIKYNFSPNYIAGCDASPGWLSHLSRRYLCKTIVIEGKKLKNIQA